MTQNTCPVTGFDCLTCEGTVCKLDKSLLRHVMIDYTNHSGMRQIRQIVPQPNGIVFGATPWHPEPQWTITAYDIRKDALRTFAIKDIHEWAPANTATGRSMISWAKQLQQSMERNARMSNRITKLHRLLSGIIGESPIAASEIETALNRLINGNRAIEAILKDEEPTWPPE